MEKFGAATNKDSKLFPVSFTKRVQCYLDSTLDPALDPSLFKGSTVCKFDSPVNTAVSFFPSCMWRRLVRA